MHPAVARTPGIGTCTCTCEPAQAILLSTAAYDARCPVCCPVHCSQLLSIRKECSGALQVVVDVALGRWVKLLSARSAAHTRLKQYELRQLLDMSEQVTISRP